MKWTRRMLLALFALVSGLAGAAILTAQGGERPVGYQTVHVTGANGGQLPVSVWYPTEARPRPTTLLGLVVMRVAPDAPVAGRDLPLVVISHGNGGGPGSHADLALALASAGFVVAAPMHGGDNFADRSAVGTASLFHGRNRELHATVDHTLDRWNDRDRIDAERIGAFGFSAGGLTVLTAVVAAPGLGFTLPPDRLADVRVPVQPWSPEQDTNVPYATNAGPIREALGSRAEFHSVPAFHAEMNASVLDFLRRVPGRHPTSPARRA